MAADPLRAELRSLAKLAAPMAVASAGQATMGLIDTAVCGRAGSAALAGAGLGGSVFIAFAILGMGLVTGVEPLVAQAFGAGDARGARRALWQGSWLALAAGAPLAALCAGTALLLGGLGLEPEVRSQAAGFLALRATSLPAWLFFTVARCYLQGLGLTRPVLAAAVLGNAANLLLDLLLVFGGAGLPAAAGPLRAVPALGAPGAGLATAIVTVIQAAVLAAAIRQVPVAGGAAGLRRPRRADLGRALRVGLPIGLQMGAEVGLFALVGVLASRLGREGIGAHQSRSPCRASRSARRSGWRRPGRCGWAGPSGPATAPPRAGPAWPRSARGPPSWAAGRSCSPPSRACSPAS